MSIFLPQKLYAIRNYYYFMSLQIIIISSNVTMQGLTPHTRIYSSESVVVNDSVSYTLFRIRVTT